MSYCNYCGTPLKTGAKFCNHCGQKIEAPVVDEAVARLRTENPRSELKPTDGNKFEMKNTQRRIMNLWVFLLFVFIFLIFLPGIIGLDGFDGGFALGFVSFFMVIMSVIIIFIYRSRAKQLDSILSGEGRIAVWFYHPDEWTRFVEGDFAEDKKVKRTIFYIISGISVVIGILLTIRYQDILIAEIVLGLIAFVAVIAFVAPYFRLKKLRKSKPQALISEKGVIVGRMFHLWVKLGASLDAVCWNDENPGTRMIEFTYSMPTRNGRDQQIARVPVPEGMAAEAQQVFEYFSRITGSGENHNGPGA